MTTPVSVRRPIALTLITVLAVAGTACGGGDGGARSGASPTSASPNANPGPNPTPAVDPGPNDTSGGPFTRQGTVVLPAGDDCITLRTDDGDLDVTIEGYARKDLADGPAVVDGDSVPRARAGDTMIVAGYEGEGESACGAAFEADSLVSVMPS